MMDLIISVFITDIRLPHSAAVFGARRYDSLDIFRTTLETYSRIKFDKVYLFIKLDTNYTNNWDDLSSYCKQLFGEHIALLENRRIEKQIDWVPVISQIPEDKFVFFLQNHDHPFVDFSADLLYEGIELMKKDPLPFKALAPSHWPEFIREAGVHNAEMIGGYLKMFCQHKDPLFIFSLPLLRHILLEKQWPEAPLWKPGMMDCLPFSIEKYPLYIPLRETCRHFDGYAHVNMRVDPEAEFPHLELPLTSIKLTEKLLRWRFKPPNIRGYSWDCPSDIKQEWEEKMIELYKNVI